MAKQYRRKGMGTIFQSGGYYYGKVMVGGKLTQKKLTTNKRESEKIWQEWLEENRPAKTQSVLHSIGDIWPTVQDGLIAKHLQASRDTYRREWRKFVDYFGKDTPLESLTRGQIVEYISKRTEGRSATTQNHLVGIVRKFFSEVLPDLKASENPLSSFTTAKDETVSRQPFTDDELKRILDAAKDAGPEWELLFYVGLYTGLRFADCAHLHTSQIRDGVIYLTPKKTMHRSARAVQIPVHPLLAEKIEAMQVSEGYYMPNLVKMCDDKKKRSLAGYYTRKIFVKAGIDTAVEVAGRSKKASVKSFHALRATFISRLAQNNVGLGLIQDIAGHLSPQMTQVYVHPAKKSKENAIQSLPNFATGAEGAEYVDETIQRILNFAKKQIAEALGDKCEAKISIDYRLTDFAKQNQREGETIDQTLDRLHIKWRNFSA